jgi:hypothetical protein
MKQKITLWVFLICLACSSLVAAETYQSSQFKIAFDAAEIWYPVQGDDPSSLTLESTEQGQKTFSLVAAAVTTPESNLAFETLSPEMKNELMIMELEYYRAHRPNDKIVSIDFETINHRTYMLTKVQTKFGDAPVHSITAWTVQNQIEYLMTFHSADMSEQFAAPFYDILQTVNFTQ